ncbi:MAG: hypothetical protein EOM20_20580, partial [Spartobacteria bacterium]|nr:hypothetical protein [Spartobacteria bacterium]
MNRYGWMWLCLLTGGILFLAGCQLMPQKEKAPALRGNLIQPALWGINNDSGGSALALSEDAQFDMPVLKADYALKGARGFSEMVYVFKEPWDIARRPLVMRLRAYADCEMEVKVIDRSGTVHGRRLNLKDTGGRWVTYVLYDPQIEFWWGPHDNFEDISELRLAFVGTGEGTVMFSHLGIAVDAVETSLAPVGALIDPDAEMSGIGFRQRRDAELRPLDP